MKTKPEISRKFRLKLGMIAVIAVFAISCQITAVSSLPNTLLSFETDRCLRPGCEEIIVQKGDLTESISVTGSVRYSNKTNLTFGSSGRIESIAVILGDSVKSGQLIATLDSSRLELDYLRAEQNLLGAVQALADLLKPTTFEELLRAEIEVDFTTDRVAQAEEALKLALEGPTRQQLISTEAVLLSAQLEVNEREEVLDEIRQEPAPGEVAQLESDIFIESVELKAAKDKLAALVEGPDTLIVDLSRNALILAKEDLETARESLEILADGPDPLLVQKTEFNLAITELQLLKTERAFKAIKRGKTKSELKNEDIVIALKRAEFEVTIADFNVEFAREELSRVLIGPTTRELAEAAANVNAAMLAFRSAKVVLEVTEREPTVEEIDQARNEITILLASIESSKSRFDSLMEPDPLIESQMESHYNIAVERLETAQQNLGDLTKLPDAAIIRERQGALDRSKELLEIAMRDLVRLRNGPEERIVEIRRAELEVTKDAASDAKQRIDEAKIVAPYDAVVSRISAKVGQVVNRDQVVAQLIDESKFEVIAGLDERKIVDLKVGQSVRAKIKALDNLVVPGVVSAISETADQDLTRDFSYWLVVALQAGEIVGFREGMSTSAEILVDERKGVLSVPIAAITNGNGQESLELVVGGQVKFVPVATGLRNGAFVEVTGDVNVGDVIRVRRRPAEVER